MKEHWRFAKNVVANLGRGSAAALVAVLLPPVLVRHMTPAAYAVWILVLETAAYVNYLNFGLQTAIGRYVAYANEKCDRLQRDAVFSTAVVGLCGAALLALLGLAVAVLAAPKIFPAVPVELVPQMRLALLLVGFSLAVGLPASACNGVFVGMERYELPAMTVGGGRLLSALGLIAAALAGRSLVEMAAILAGINLLSYVAQYMVLRRVVPDLRFQPGMVQRSVARELYGYCAGLTVMSFSMLLVTGLDLVLVGRFDFAAVTPYSVSASMILLFSGLLYAGVNVILPHGAAIHARGEVRELGGLVITATRLSVLVLILTGLPVLLYAGPILRVWIGQRYESSAVLLAILILANIIRLIGAPYSVVLISAGQQNYIKVSPLSEGFSNLVASVALGAFFGGIGVALGTLVGAVVSIGSHLWYSMPRTRMAIDFSRRRFVLSGVLLPALSTSPLLAAGAASMSGIRVGPLTVLLAMLLSLAGAALLVLRTGSKTAELLRRLPGNKFIQALASRD